MSTFVRSMLERAGKSALQMYLVMWGFQEGLGDTSAEVPGAEAFDQMFDVDNLKAAGAAFVLSVLTSLISRPIGPDPQSPSLVVAEVDPPRAA